MSQTERYLEAKETLRMARASLDYATAYPERATVSIATLRANVATADAACERLFNHF